MKPTIVRSKNARTVDLCLGRYRVMRLTRRRTGIVYGPFTWLLAHKGGKSVLRSEIAGKPWRKLTLICGALVCTRWGSVMLQWRGFPQA